MKRKCKTITVGQLATQKLLLTVDMLRQISKAYPKTQRTVRKINNLLRNIPLEIIVSPFSKKRIRLEDDL